MNPAIGDRFGKMTVLGLAISLNGRKWPVQCDCKSRVRTVNVNQLQRWENMGTGCRECMQRFKHHHGSTKNRTYGTWYSMRQRCLNPKSLGFKYYGAQGVIICDRWLESFSNFLEDMGERPDAKTLDRIDPYGNYEPSN